MCKLVLSTIPHVRADQSDTRMQPAFGRARHVIPKGFYTGRAHESGATYHDWEWDRAAEIADRMRRDRRNARKGN